MVEGSLGDWVHQNMHMVARSESQKVRGRISHLRGARWGM